MECVVLVLRFAVVEVGQAVAAYATCHVDFEAVVEGPDEAVDPGDHQRVVLAEKL